MDVIREMVCTQVNDSTTLKNTPSGSMGILLATSLLDGTADDPKASDHTNAATYSNQMTTMPLPLLSAVLVDSQGVLVDSHSKPVGS